MKIKVFIIGSEPSGAVFSLEEQVRYIFGNFLAENGGIEKFAAVRDAINSISQAFADSQTVIFLVADDIFGYTKLTISKAFGFDMKVEQNILENALQHHELHQDHVCVCRSCCDALPWWILTCHHGTEIWSGCHFGESPSEAVRYKP